MPFDGSGNYNRNFPPGGWQGDAAANIKIKADRHDQHDGDFATALSNVICKDGQSSPSADIGFNSKKIINLANPASPQDAATKNYVDGIRNFSSAISITGSTPESHLKYTGTTGPWGDSYVTADLAFGVSGTTFIWNDKADFTGNSLMSLSEIGILSVSNYVDDANPGPYLSLFRTSATPAASDYIGGINFYGKDSTAVTTMYGRILAQIMDPANGSEDGRLMIDVMVAGTLANRLICDDGGVEVTGELSTSQSVWAASGFFIGSTTTAIMGPRTGGTSTGIIFRPTSYNLSTGAMTISPAGNVVVTGTLDVNGTSTQCNVFYAGEISQGINGVANSCITNAGGAFFEGPNGGWAAGKVGGNGTLAGIYQGATACGSITVANAATTAYNTSSDIRIKKGVKGVTGASARTVVDAIQVIEFEPIEKLGKIVEVQGVVPGPEVWMGFSAQQAYEVFPTAVAPPEAMIGQIELYKADAKYGEEGFVPWMLDYSKFVPVLMANVQELNARNDALEARLASLEKTA